MNREECLQCGTRIVGNDCATCDRTGRTEALAMAGILVLIALCLGLYVWLQMM